MHVFAFEKLSVLDDIKELTKLLYLIAAEFPETEKFGLVSQLRRSAISVGSNVAEGSSRLSNKDQAHVSVLG